MREEFSAWSVQACVSGKRHGWTVREQYKGLGYQGNTGRERELIRETKGAPNINLSSLGAFFVELIMSLTKLFWRTGNEILLLSRDKKDFPTSALGAELQGLLSLS